MSEQQANLAYLPTVSVVIAAFATERWNDTQEAVASVRTQTVPAFETILVIDHNPASSPSRRTRARGRHRAPQCRQQGRFGRA